ncbi:MAG: MBL fold metallo-hydrolase, partial [Defluviitaleaceae bacterium]|nr:MBL fold metallo-hydrolase [Defluviitaleaceae bacterium]
MIEHIQGNLYRMSIPLPGSALKTLNSYVMKSASRNLIVDTGFNQPECLEAMLAGIKELGLDMSNTDILSTHLHADHNGLISQIISDTSVVYMSGPDRETFIKYMTDGDA